MPYADHNGVRIHYQVEGDGPPLVLQHGFTSSLRRWYLYGYVDALMGRLSIDQSAMPPEIREELFAAV